MSGTAPLLENAYAVGPDHPGEHSQRNSQVSAPEPQLPSSCTTRIWTSTLLLLCLGVVAEVFAALLYCASAQGLSHCTSNYRSLDVEYSDIWGSSVQKPAQEDYPKLLDGSNQVPGDDSWSSPPQPHWQLEVTFRSRSYSSYSGVIASYGPSGFLQATGTTSQYGGWALSQSATGTLDLVSGVDTYSAPLSSSIAVDTWLVATIKADTSVGTISFEVFSENGTCALTTYCSHAVSGSLDFSDFDSNNPNYKLVVGGRGDDATTLMNDYSETFTGQLKNLDQTIRAGAEYAVLFLLMFVATLCYCTLWVSGQWIVASKSEELNAEVKQGEREQTRFVNKQLGKEPPVQHPEWNQAIKQWQLCKKLYSKTNEADTEHKWIRVYGLRVIFFLLVVLDMFVVLWLAAPNGEGLYSSSDFGTAFAKAWNFQAAPIGWVFLLSSIVETTLFMIGCVCVVWPKQQRDPTALPGQGLGPATGDPYRRVSVVAEETNSTCLLIACHNSALDEGMRTDLERTLHAALENFPPESIFVCDNGRGLHPSDDTQGLCRRVCKERFPEESRKINYVYIPEGNKTHALYWVSEWWIPFLMQKDKIPDFEYLVMIDDDVPLPKNFDFHAAQMNANPTIAACGYAITAVTPTDPITGKSEPNFLVDMQDVEYRLSGFFKLVQAQLGGSAFYAHGAVSLWRRKLLGREILYKHDTEFHGEDLYMGLLLHRQAQGNRINFSAANVVETFAPDHFKLLFKQRTKSWDLATHRKFPSILGELLFRWKNQFLFLKVFHLGEVIAVIQDWIRLYLFVLLLLTNPIVLAGITCFFFAIAYLQLILFRFVVLRERPDLKKKLGFVSLLCFPLYKTGTTFMFRQYAMMENAFYYATNFKRHTVETRLTWSRDPVLRERAILELGDEQAQLLMSSESANFPPRPLETEPNWWHVWQLPGEASSQRVARQSQQLGCLALAPKCVVKRITELTGGHPPQLAATHPENQARLAHMMLAHVTLLQVGVESQHSSFRDEHRMGSSVALLRKEVYDEIISRMKIAPTALYNDGRGKNSLLKSEPARYQARLIECVDMWQTAINETLAQNIPKGDPRYARYMFMTKEIAEMDPSYPWQRDLVTGTLFGLSAVIEELAKMRIPDAHDVFSMTKKRIHDAIRELETGKLMKRS